jgi:hypothetical protein
VLQHRDFDLRQTINFAVEPINNDDLDSERLRWRAGTIAGTMPRSSMFSLLAAGGRLFALEPIVHALPDLQRLNKLACASAFQSDVGTCY